MQKQNDYVKCIWWIYILCLKYRKPSFFKNVIRVCFLTTNNRLLHILYHSISLKNEEKSNFENPCLGNACDPIFTPLRKKKNYSNWWNRNELPYFSFQQSIYVIYWHDISHSHCKDEKYMKYVFQIVHKSNFFMWKIQLEQRWQCIFSNDLIIICNIIFLYFYVGPEVVIKMSSKRKKTQKIS